MLAFLGSIVMGFTILAATELKLQTFTIIRLTTMIMALALRLSVPLMFITT
jgi:hypothetical protein